MTDLHACYECGKAPKFYCLCSPKAICGHCICDAEFAIVKGNKGLCSGCLELVLLIEENKDVDSHGVCIVCNKYCSFLSVANFLTTHHLFSHVCKPS